jgi:hypothetical protein
VGRQRVQVVAFERPFQRVNFQGILSEDGNSDRGLVPG